MIDKMLPISVYSTIFDEAYLPRALALHASLMRVNTTARFAFFCIDEKSADLLETIAPERAIFIRHDQFSTPELMKIRAHRSRGEYCWTSKPIALRYLARTMTDADWLVYVDADMMFFSDPDLVLPDKDKHYMLTPHRFHKAFKQYEHSVGDFNAGYMAARRSPKGLQVIDWWSARCIESCSVVPTKTTFADQKYLDQMPLLFPFGDVMPSLGLNAAPWNIESYRINVRNGHVYLGEYLLVLYHFQGLKVLSDSLVDLYGGNIRLSSSLRKLVYMPYIKRLMDAQKKLRLFYPESVKTRPIKLRQWIKLGAKLVLGHHNFLYFKKSNICEEFRTSC